MQDESIEEKQKKFLDIMSWHFKEKSNPVGFYNAIGKIERHLEAFNTNFQNSNELLKKVDSHLDRLNTNLKIMDNSSSVLAKVLNHITIAGVLVGFLGVLITAVALWFSVREGYLNRQYQKMTLLPVINISFMHNEKSAGYIFGNIGPGPARLEWFEVLVDKQPIPHWDAMLEKLGINDSNYDFLVPHRGLFYAGNQGMHQIIRLKNESAIYKFIKEQNKIEIKFCYSSVFGEAWLVSNRTGAKPIATCKPYPEIEFIYNAKKMTEIANSKIASLK